MKHTIELSIEDINRMVVEDLQNTFKWHLDDEEAQRELMDAIEVLLSYYMKSSDYSAWFVSRGRDE